MRIFNRKSASEPFMFQRNDKYRLSGIPCIIKREPCADITRAEEPPFSRPYRRPFRFDLFYPLEWNRSVFESGKGIFLQKDCIIRDFNQGIAINNFTVHNTP